MREEEVGTIRIDAQGLQRFLHDAQAFRVKHSRVDYEIPVRPFHHVRVDAPQDVVGEGNLDPEDVREHFLDDICCQMELPRFRGLFVARVASVDRMLSPVLHG